MEEDEISPGSIEEAKNQKSEGQEEEVEEEERNDKFPRNIVPLSSLLSKKYREPKYPIRRGVPKTISSFTRGRSNFSSGTLPTLRTESTPVNTLSTGHSSKVMLKTFKIERDGKVHRSLLLPGILPPEGLHPGTSSSSPPGEIPAEDEGAPHAENTTNLTSSPMYVDQFDYPMNRMYLNDSIFHLRAKPYVDCAPRRFSLPSTHILYEKNKHRGGASIMEKEMVTEMLRKRAALTQKEPVLTEEEIERNRAPAELSLDIRISGPLNDDNFIYLNMDADLMKEFFEELLSQSHVDRTTWTRVGHLPRAVYEDQCYLFEAHVVLKPIQDVKEIQDLLIKFVKEFSSQLKCMLHDQAFFEIPKFRSIFPKIVPQHADIPFSAIAMGSCINPGTFFVRGDYITNDNAICSLKLYPPNSNDASRESHAFKVAGTNPYLSYARLEHDRRVILLYFGIRLQDLPPDGLEYTGYRINLYYSSFVNIVADMSNEKVNSLYIQLKHPVQLWEAIPKSSLFHPSKSRVLNMESCVDWIRVLSWPGDADGRGVGCSSEAFSQSNWIRIVFKKDDETNFPQPRQNFLEMVSRLASRSHAKITFGSVFSIRRKLAPVPRIEDLGSFRANYALFALTTRGSVVNDQLFDWAKYGVEEEEENVEDCPASLEKEPMFLKVVRRSMKECSRACEETLEQLLNAVDERRAVSLLDAFLKLYNSRREQYERLLSGEKLQDVGLAKPLPKNCVAVAKVMVCPTKMIFMAPEVMMVNRVVRKFGPDYALRCVFRDDNGGRLVLRDFSLGNIDHVSNSVSEIIYNTLKFGIDVANRHYSFLGWSNSQMRDQGCYLYAPRVDPKTGELSGTVEQIRSWIGDFSEAISVPKMMSRMGQCFTQAQPTVKLHPKHWVVEQDIEGGANKAYCFSDGCGRVSYKLAAKMTRMLHLKEVPSCFQVRFKGFKGIVVIDPMIDEIVDMPKIVFRNSQRKFIDASRGQSVDYLEVVKYAMPSPVCLNRPFITILDQVSAKQSAMSHDRICSRVHYYLERELSLLSNMLVHEKSAAEELMNRTNLPIDWAMATNQCGFDLTTDPFVRSMIVSVYRYNIIHHISKAKIFLPGNMGRSMYGVVDETGLLQHGQVFIQYSPSLRQTSNRPILMTGKVLITKNPCHVPGDVRIFQAVSQPSLSHLVDVVVFPQHGPRPHPDEMAGSDLDGDEYSIIWDQEMLLDHNEKAMIFPSSVAVEEDKEPSTDDMVEFFLKYLQQDSIGRMSNAHLAFADCHGLFHEHCHSIALKCAVAVDFPKSGIPAEPLANFEQCDSAPDYMMPTGKPMYYSTKLNGQLFRKARKVEEILEEYERRGSIFEGEYDKLICPDDIDVFFGSEKKLSEAIGIREEYARRIQQLLDEYGIEDEASIVSGHAAIIKRLAGMEKDDYSFYHTDKVLELRYEKLYEAFRDKFFEEFGGEEVNRVMENQKDYVRSTPAMHEKIRQWYYVTNVMPKVNRSGSKIGQSLPWVVWEVLCDLRRKLMLTQNLPTTRPKYPIATRFEEEMHKSIEAKSDEFAQFCAKVEKDPNALCVKRYSHFYGFSLIKAVFILEQWLINENLFNSERITIWHVARILIQFALGKVLESVSLDYERKNMPRQPLFSKMIPKTPSSDEKPEIIQDFDLGSLMIEFLRYLAGQSFISEKRLSLRVFEEPTVVEPILFRNEQWIPLHHVAYRAFHSIAISGRFEAMSLSPNPDDNEYISESKDPALVSESLFSSKSYNDTPISRHRVIAALKHWSGVKEVIPRDNNGRKADMVYVTSVGTVLARQRLARLMLLSGETIRDAILNDRIPEEVRDDYL